MELYKEILAHALAQGEIKITFPGQNCDFAKIVESVSYRALQKIKSIVEDDSLEDDACFMKIEEIVCAFEEIGSNGGTRHDFG